MEQMDTSVKTEKYTPRQKKTRRRVWISRIIFTLFLIAYMGVAFHYAKIGYDWLMDWLLRYEASQPDIRSQEVFEQLFAEPDWEALYTMAGEEDTVYEGADEYAAYMNALVGDTKLTYVETSAGLSGNKKYIVKCNNAKIAEFTLTDISPEEEEIPDWTLDEVFVYYTRQESLTIFTVPGHTVYINGVALNTEEHMVSTTSTVVEDYLPDDLHGYRDMTLYFEGLLVQPEVTILDENGQQMEVVRQENTNHYAEVLAAPDPISQEFQELVINAAQTYGRYMINATNSTLSTYFDKNGKAYQDIILYEKWTMQKYQSFEFVDSVVTNYYQYSDSLFSARVSMELDVTFKSMFTGEITVKPYYIDTTFFVHLTEDGKWLVDTMTNVDVSEATTMVKLRYVNGNKEIHSEWVDSRAASITLPEVTVPNGKTFLGWFTKSVSGNDTFFSLVFQGSENGIVTLPEGNELTFMVLYAQFK